MMAQIDIYRRADEGIAFLLDLQDDMLEVLSTRVVAPMVPEGAVGPAMRDLNPILTQGGASNQGPPARSRRSQPPHAFTNFTSTGTGLAMLLKTGEYFCAIRTSSSFCSSDRSASILKNTRMFL